MYYYHLFIFKTVYGKTKRVDSSIYINICIEKGKILKGKLFPDAKWLIYWSCRVCEKVLYFLWHLVFNFENYEITADDIVNSGIGKVEIASPKRI